MLKVLMRSKLLALLSWITGATRKNKAQKKSSLYLFAGLMVYALGSLGFLFYHIFETIALPMHAVGMDWLYFTFAAVFAFGLMFIGCTFTAKAQLYDARDNSMLLALPIKGSDILLSRLFMLAVINFVLGLLVYVPAGILRVKIAGFTAISAISFVLSLFFVLLLALSISALCGWLIHIAVTKIPGNKALLTTAFSLAFVGVYMYVNFNMNKLLTRLAESPENAAGALSAVKPLYWMGMACESGGLKYLLLSASVPAAAFAVMYILLSRSFIRTSTATSATGEKKKYVETTARELSPERALLKKEADRFFTCPAYMINAGLGAMFAPISAVVLLIKWDSLRGSLSAVPGIIELMPPLFILALCFMASMTVITAPAISLEGNNLWIARSLPVSPRKLLSAKLKLHCLVGMPTLIPLCIICAVISEASVTLLPLFFIVPMAMVFLSAVSGLYFGLKYPNLDWTNETQAVKSSMGALAAIGICMGFTALPVIVIMVTDIAIEPVVWVFCLVLTAADLLFYRLAFTKGIKLFCEL